jgi:hypothetical protein
VPDCIQSCCWLASHQCNHCLCLKPRLMPRGIPQCTESSQAKPNAGSALANDRPAPHLLTSRCSHTLADDAARRAASASVELSVVPAVRLGGGPCPRRGWVPGGQKAGACVPRIRESERPDPARQLPEPQARQHFWLVCGQESTTFLVTPHGVAPSRRYKAGIHRASFTAQNAPVKEMMFPWYLVGMAMQPARRRP